jgi:hypothetical protein
VFTGIIEAALPVGEARRDGGLLRVSLDLTALTTMVNRFLS